MRIDELETGQAITLIATTDNELQQLELDTVVQETYAKKRLILADPIYREDKVVSFKAKNLVIHLLVKYTDKTPQIFKNVTVMLMKKQDNSLCYSITCENDSKIFNRRESFRCFAGTPTTIKLALSSDAHEATIRDVSTGGFSVICSSDVEFNNGMVLHVLLEDYIEEISENFTFHLYGIVVRKQELNNGRVLYGCKMNNKIAGLETYVVKKERVRLKRSNGR